MNITRKQFCGVLAGGSVVLLLKACGGGGYSAPAAGTAMSCGASGTAIAGNHGHLLVIAAADLDSMVNKTYSIQYTADHDHQVTFTPAQLQTLKGGGSVTVTSTVGTSAAFPAHSHSVTATCA